MSVLITKRTRTLTDGKYSEWSEWVSSIDSPPYNNTDLIEYKILSEYDSLINFKREYFLIYATLMQEATKEGTPYSSSLAQLKEEFETRSITEEQKAILTAQYMANITNSVTLQAMQMAMTLTDREIKTPNEFALQSIQKEIAEQTKLDKIEISKWQEKTSEENYNYAKEKAIALPASVIFNNWSKALDYFSESYGQHKIGGGVITPSMWAVPLDIAKAISLSDVNYDFTYGNVTPSE